MSINMLPPQAYTKEMVTQAFNWLKSQPQHIQEMAKSADTMVALYQKSQMHGDSYFERPSIQSFKSELKNLAGMMGEFEGQKPPVTPNNGIPFQASFQVNGQNSVFPQAAQPSMPPPATMPPPAAVQNQGFTLDPKSSMMIQEVKEVFNLSSDTEVLRLLISIGYQKIKSTF